MNTSFPSITHFPPRVEDVSSVAGCNGLRSTGMEFGCTRTYVFDITLTFLILHLCVWYHTARQLTKDERFRHEDSQKCGHHSSWGRRECVGGLGVRVAHDYYRFHAFGQEKCLNVKFMHNEQMSSLGGEFYAFVNFWNLLFSHVYFLFCLTV